MPTFSFNYFYLQLMALFSNACKIYSIVEKRERCSLGTIHCNFKRNPEVWISALVAEYNFNLTGQLQSTVSVWRSNETVDGAQ